MPCPMVEDRNAMPPQSLDDFKRKLSGNVEARVRLQELADQIPRSDGIGAVLDEQLEECHRLRGDLALARCRAKETGIAYAQRIKLLQEERDLLESLGLTENLYREHDDDGYA